MNNDILQQIRSEIERSYKPRDGRMELADASQLSEVASPGLRSALAALHASYALVGQTPPEPPTLRGRLGSRLVKLVQRLLFWYTPQIVHFQYSALRAMEELANEIQQQANAIQQLEKGLQQQANGIRHLENGFPQLEKGIRQLEHNACRDRQDMLASVGAAMSRTEVLERRLEALRLQAFARMEREIARLGAQQTVQENRMALLMEAQSPSPDPAAALGDRLRAERSHRIDSLYAALEDEFRGSRQEIRERLSVYLPKLTEAGIGGQSMPVLDVGCGRGEWLDLLRENHLQASGIDLNRVLLALCQERGLPVMEAEAVAYLRSLPEASLGAVTVFHVIEHLPLPHLLDLLDAALRALKPGGVAIFETPNPNNMFVSSRYFYLDPTHRHPIPPLLGRFLAEARGFARVEILELHPWPEQHHVDTRTGGDMAARFNECFYGPQDYAIIGWKA